jgi:hypothetical protein
MILVVNAVQYFGFIIDDEDAVATNEDDYEK